MGSLFRQRVERLVLTCFILQAAALTGVKAQEADGAETVNPASKHCIQQGGLHLIETNSDGGQRGICVLSDQRRCDEWEFFRGECSTNEKIDDPFAYCAAIPDSDIIPLARTGGNLPAVLLVSMLEQGLVSSDMPPAMQGAAEWRCMGSDVWVCTVGANLPCSEKADPAKTASQPMMAFCQTHGGADIIPATVTGRATIFAWECDGAEPRITRKVLSADVAGYLSEFWVRLEPLTTPQKSP